MLLDQCGDGFTLKAARVGYAVNLQPRGFRADVRVKPAGAGKQHIGWHGHLCRDVVGRTEGGFAFGYDRWAMILAGLPSLREVIAFPKTQRGQDLLMDAPSAVEPEQLEELSLRTVAPPDTDP